MHLLRHARQVLHARCVIHGGCPGQGARDREGAGFDALDGDLEGFGFGKGGDGGVGDEVVGF